MSAEFVPFLAGLKSRMAAPASAEAGFAPIGAANPPGSPSQTVATPNCAAPDGRESRVELRRSGERITHIQVHCRCGETIEIECEY